MSTAGRNQPSRCLSQNTVIKPLTAWGRFPQIAAIIARRGACMWLITEAEAVEIYARYFAARHKSTASQRARDTANSLQSKGDLNGHKVWNEVADTIDRHQQEKRRALRQPSH
jgi:hypothetical protein